MDRWRISNVITQQRVNKSICHKTKIFGGIFNCAEKAAGSHFNCWTIDILNSTRNNFPVSMASVPPPTTSLWVLNPKVPGRKLKIAPGSFICEDLKALETALFITVCVMASWMSLQSVVYSLGPSQFGCPLYMSL